ncbi:MAG TPA: CBS domain-containing protein [Vicinamibacteria bacterium]|nr:CBS domain-containing protein [Vicinamibacteria bacterium]
MTTTIRQILAKKPAVYSIDIQATVYEALKMMADKNVGALVVLEGEKLAGIFSERDYARKVVLLGKSSKDTPVSELMTAKVVTIDPDRTAGECMALMTERRFRHLPVIDGGKLVGVISIGDIVRTVVDEQQFTIKQLENYVSSGG